ncbi:MAG: sulfurtransferase, partial [Myxococcota bacterium]
MARFVNIAAYHFAELDALAERRDRLRSLCKQQGLCGTILLSPEGINLFVGGSRGGVDALLTHLRGDPLLEELVAKESYSERKPFRRMLVKLKREIIAFGQPVDVGNAPRLAPQELKRWLDEGRPVHLLDTRNRFEIDLGTFTGAVDPEIDNFRDFPEVVEQLRNRLDGAPIVTFCTGGIRCEKAAPYLLDHGFENVWQLDGGILKYFEECGGAHYDGECFVFDQRVALDPKLLETETAQCFACQHPLSPEEQRSALYVEGTSCPHCYVDDEAARQARIEQRNHALVAHLLVLPGSTPADNERPLHIGGAHDGRSIGEVLETVHPHVEDWAQRVRDGRIRRRGEALAWDSVVRAGDVVVHVEPNVIEPDVSRDVRVIYEDDWIVAIDKPTPLPMHPSGRFNRNTLESFLRPLY